MKLQFDANLDFQHEAINAVVDITGDWQLGMLRHFFLKGSRRDSPNPDLMPFVSLGALPKKKIAGLLKHGWTQSDANGRR